MFSQTGLVGQTDSGMGVLRYRARRALRVASDTLLNGVLDPGQHCLHMANVDTDQIIYMVAYSGLG